MSQHKPIVSKVAAAIFLLGAFISIDTTELNALMYLNASDCAFDNSCNDQPDGSASHGNNKSLGQLIAEGGSYFLKSISDIHLLLSRVEASEVRQIETGALQEAVNSAVAHLEFAQSIYLQLKNQADATPYNSPVIRRLQTFDYNGFQRHYRLMPDIFDNVRALLETGDVRGVYHRIYNNTGNLLERLTAVQKELNAGKFPTLSNLWRINQQCSQYKLFGQYVARVFFKNNKRSLRLGLEKKSVIKE